MQIVETIVLNIDDRKININRFEDGSFQKPDYLLEANREIIREKSYELKKSAIGWPGAINTTKPRSLSNEITKPSSPEAIQWDGWGSNLKPAYEPILVCRKPISEKTIAENVLKWGVGGINIDECRVETDKNDKIFGSDKPFGFNKREKSSQGRLYFTKGRWPANIIHDGSDEVMELFPNINHGNNNPSKRYKRHRKGHKLSSSFGFANAIDNYGDSGSAARFFYCAKATRKERGESNNHPTVKPLKLIEYLVKLVTPQNGVVLDCFAGSGTTGIAARNLNRDFILIEKEKKYIDLIKERLAEPTQLLIMDDK